MKTVTSVTALPGKKKRGSRQLRGDCPSDNNREDNSAVTSEGDSSQTKTHTGGCTITGDRVSVSDKTITNVDYSKVVDATSSATVMEDNERTSADNNVPTGKVVESVVIPTSITGEKSSISGNTIVVANSPNVVGTVLSGTVMEDNGRTSTDNNVAADHVSESIALPSTVTVVAENIDGSASDNAQHTNTDVVMNVDKSDAMTVPIPEILTDPVFERYRLTVEEFIASGSYIASDVLLTNRYEFMDPRKKIGTGKICLDVGVNREAMFTFVGRVLPDSLTMGSSPEWDDRDVSKFRNSRYRLGVGPVRSSPVLHRHFDQGTSLIRRIIEENSKAQHPNLQSILHYSGAGPDRTFGIKLSKRFFEYKKKPLGGKVEEVVWKWDEKEVSDYYDRHLSQSLVPTRFPAEASDMTEINPEMMEKALTDAIVAVSFKIHNFTFEAREVYTADVVSVRVLGT